MTTKKETQENQQNWDLRSFFSSSIPKSAVNPSSDALPSIKKDFKKKIPSPCAICVLPEYAAWRPVNKTSQALEIRTIPVMVDREGLLNIVMEKRIVHTQCYLNLMSSTGGDVEP